MYTAMLPEDVQSLLDTVSLRPLIVDHLGRDAALLPRLNLVLIDAGIDERRLGMVIDRVLAEAASRLS